jgi:hypothetical protein
VQDGEDCKEGFEAKQFRPCDAGIKAEGCGRKTGEERFDPARGCAWQGRSSRRV